MSSKGGIPLRLSRRLLLLLDVGLLLCFPLGIFPLSVLAFKERLNFRKKDAGEDFHLVIGDPCAVIIGLFLARHGITPLKLPLAEQVALEHRAIPSDEAAPCILGYLFGGVGVIENDLRKHAVRSAANTKIYVVAYLAGDDGGVRSLRGEDQMNTESPPLSCDCRQLVFHLCQQLLPLVIGSGLVQHLRHLVTGKYEPWDRQLRSLVVGVDVRTAQRSELALAVFQHRHKLIESIAQIFLCKTHPAFLMPYLGKVNVAFEIGNIDLRSFVECLHEQQLEQGAFPAACRAAQ